MSMENFLFGSDLEDSEDEGKTAKEGKAAEQAQLNDLFGDSPSEGEDEVEHEGEASESDREEADSGDEKMKENKMEAQEREEEDEEEEGGEDDGNDDENEVGTGEFIINTQ